MSLSAAPLRIGWRAEKWQYFHAGDAELREQTESCSALASPHGSCCYAVSLGHYQTKDQRQGTLEKAASVEGMPTAQFKALS